MHSLALTLAALLPAAPPAPVDFDTEVLPVLTRAGCNSGACHGAAAGRGGFRLSLWGSDPAADHDSLVRELEGRRVDLTRPDRSLVLLKPTRKISHGGGKRLEPNDDGANLLLRWIESGAPRSGTRRLARFEIEPAQKLVAAPGEAVTLKATAHFDDNTSRDVTAWTVFTSTDPTSLELDGTGRFKVMRRGEHVLLARFLERVVPVRLTLPVGDTAVDLGKSPRRNFIDDEVLSTLETLRLPPATTSDDATFLRRVHLDLTGTLPTPEQVKAFLADTAKDKRDKVIDQLLASEDFNDYWTLHHSNLLQVTSRRLGPDGAKLFHGWLRQQIADKLPLDALAREMLTALGDARKLGPVNFSRVPADARSQAEYVGRVFLGVRIQCANCHNHPLDRWTQDDYHGLSAVFARLERGPVVKLAGHGEVIHPRTGEPAVPRLPGEKFLKADADNRDDLAKWLTDADNPFFARAAVNRLWKAMMGRGLVEPVDDLRVTNPATHPKLLDRLAEDFVKNGHDLRHTLRLIARSETYQRSGATTGPAMTDDRFYARALTRPLPAEVRADSIAVVTGVPDRHGDLPAGTRAITLYDSLIPSPALDVLGRCSRSEPCETEAGGAGLGRALHLVNGDLLNRKIGSKDGRLHKLLASDASTAEMIEGFYLLALCRPPTREEKTYWEKELGTLKGDERRQAFEDFVWGLLTSREFTSNH